MLLTPVEWACRAGKMEQGCVVKISRWKPYRYTPHTFTQDIHHIPFTQNVLIAIRCPLLKQDIAIMYIITCTQPHKHTSSVSSIHHHMHTTAQTHNHTHTWLTHISVSSIHYHMWVCVGTPTTDWDYDICHTHLTTQLSNTTLTQHVFM